MRVTINLPGVTPDLLDLAVSYLGMTSRTEYLRTTLLDSLECVKADAIPGPHVDCIGSASDLEAELGLVREVDQTTAEIESLRAEVARLRAELRDIDGESWKDADL